jgi:probable rRNA maturation factor
MTRTARPSRPQRPVTALRRPVRRTARGLSQAPRLTIRVANNQSVLRIRSSELRRIARMTLIAEKVQSAEISIAVVDDATIHRLNRRHLDHDFPTDVLSFLLESETETDSDEAARAEGRPSKLRRIDGEVILSSETAVRSAERLKLRAADEAALYLVHGLLHLCGYDDMTPKRRRAMRRRECAILCSLGVPEGPRPTK